MRFSWREGILWAIGGCVVLGVMASTWSLRTCGYGGVEQLIFILVPIYLWPILLVIAALFFTVGGFAKLKAAYAGTLFSVALVSVIFMAAFIGHPEHVSCSVP